ncbi:hypothetical protein ACWC5C_31810 [Streptomyces sp. NPDC001700]
MEDLASTTATTFVTVCHEEALVAAGRAERALMAGEEAGPLLGVPSPSSTSPRSRGCR